LAILSVSQTRPRQQVSSKDQFRFQQTPQSSESVDETVKPDLLYKIVIIMPDDIWLVVTSVNTADYDV